METLFSLLGLYQLLGVMLPGAVAVGGTYYAVSGLPPDPSAGALLGLVILFYLAGNVVQGAAVVWEGPYWARTGGWPSVRRLSPGDPKAYAEPFRALIVARLDALTAVQTATIPIADQFGLARAELRRQGQDDRAESFNAIYGLSRGLVTGAAVVGVANIACVVTGHDSGRNLLAFGTVALCTVPVFHRFRRFSYYFADEVWRDFAALPAASKPISSRTRRLIASNAPVVSADALDAGDHRS